MSAARWMHACVVAAVVFAAACGDDHPDWTRSEGVDGGPSLELPFGVPCTRNVDCTTGACVQIAEGRGICTYGCDNQAACPTGPNWACAFSPYFGVSICDCASDSTEEICRDGVDNDCDGVVDCEGDRPDLQCPGSPGCPMDPDLCSLDPALCPTCASDVDCDDGLACTRDLCRLRGCLHVPDDKLCESTEVCRLGTGCELGVPCATHAECADTDACTRAEHCDAQNRVCRFVILDGDDDERYPVSCGGNDCDDSDPDTFEGALDVCDGEDNDCDGVIDPPSAGLACGPGRTCWQGECLCDVDHIDCRQRCLPMSAFLEDDLNCGGCGIVCATGFTCDAGACVDVDECVLVPGWCGVNSTCSHPSVTGLPSCTCTPGYQSSDGSNCFDIDECAIDSDNCSDNPAACVDTDGSFDCECPAGYSGNGVGPTGCADVNECAMAMDNCQDAPLALCQNTTGGFYCQCATGYNDPGFDDTNCSDVNECTQNSDNCSAVPDACVNTVGSFQCDCPNGYTGTGVGAGSCVDQDECQLGSGSCTADLRCMNTVGTYGCATQILQVATGEDHVCALFVGGSVKCWGENVFGQLGLGNTVSRGDNPDELANNLLKVDLGTGRTAKAISAGASHTCAILDNDAVKCWGSNSYGQLGLGNAVGRGDNPNEMGDALPQVSLGSGRTALAIGAGEAHTCVLLDDHSVKCWGYNAHGQLGLGSTTNRGSGANQMGDSLPIVTLGTGRTVLGLSVGGYHNCAVLDDHSVKCWGANSLGGLGLGNTQNRGDGINEMGDMLPTVALGTGRTAKAVSAGSSATCVILDDDTVKCWGSGSAGQLGHGLTTNLGDGANEMGDMLPVVAIGALPPKSIVVGEGHVCVALSNDTLRCWGGNAYGQLGVGNTFAVGDQVAEMGDALMTIDLGTGRTVSAASNSHGVTTCALLDNGMVKCWGYNGTGQLGLGDTLSRGDMLLEMGDALPFVPASDLVPGL